MQSMGNQRLRRAPGKPMTTGPVLCVIKKKTSGWLQPDVLLKNRNAERKNNIITTMKDFFVGNLVNNE